MNEQNIETMTSEQLRMAIINLYTEIGNNSYLQHLRHAAVERLIRRYEVQSELEKSEEKNSVVLPKLKKVTLPTLTPVEK